MAPGVNLRPRRPRWLGPPEVVLAAGESASGLAYMVARLLEDNVRDFPTRVLAAVCTRGDVVLRTTDADTAVTVSFRTGEVVVDDGPKSGATVMAGEWLHLAEVCSGSRSVLGALARGDLRLQRGDGWRAAVGAGLALSVPGSFYRSDGGRRRRRAGAALLGLGAVALVMAAAGRPEKRLTRSRADITFGPGSYRET